MNPGIPRILTLVFLGAMLSISACNKNKGSHNLVDPPGADSLDFTYTVNGVRDLTMEQLDEAEMKISIQKTSFQSEEVGLRIQELPRGMEVDFSPGYALASYPATIRFRTERVATGVYPLVLETYSAHTGIQSHPFQISVTPYSNHAEAFKAEFNENRQCDVTGEDTHSCFLEPVEGIINRIRIKGFWSPSWKSEIIADLQPETGKLNIPQQWVNQAMISGQGTYNDDTLRLEYTIQTNVFVDQCQSVISRR